MLELLLVKNDRWVVILRVVSSFLSFKAAVVVVVKKMAYCHCFFHYCNVGFDWIRLYFVLGCFVASPNRCHRRGVLNHVHSTRRRILLVG